jgi:hypothetical protein
LPLILIIDHPGGLGYFQRGLLTLQNALYRIKLPCLLLSLRLFKVGPKIEPFSEKLFFKENQTMK